MQTIFFLIGDINIDLLKYDTHTDTSKFIDTLISYNFQPLSLLPTRITDTSATLIDHIYFKGNSKRNNIQIDKIFTGNIITDITDHLANFIILPKYVNKSTCNDRPLTRIFSTANKNTFTNHLMRYDWNLNVLNCDDVNVAYNNFISALTDSYDKSFPLCRISRKRFKDKKWVTQGIRKSSENKNRLYKAWMKSKDPTDKEKYRNYSKIFNNILYLAESR